MPRPPSLTKSDDKEGGMRKRGGRGGKRGGRERDKGKGGGAARKQWESVTFSSLLLGLWTSTEPHSYVSQMLNQES